MSGSSFTFLTRNIHERGTARSHLSVRSMRLWSKGAARPEPFPVRAQASSLNRTSSVAIVPAVRPGCS